MGQSIYYSFNGDVMEWNTGCVKYMNQMFNGASSFNRDVSGWDTKNVWDKCSIINILPLVYGFSSHIKTSWFNEKTFITSNLLPTQAAKNELTQQTRITKLINSRFDRCQQKWTQTLTDKVCNFFPVYVYVHVESNTS